MPKKSRPVANATPSWSMSHVFPSPGFLTEKMFLIQASGLTPSPAQPEADERIRARLFTRRGLVRMLRAKRIRDGKTLVGLLWLLGRIPLRHVVNRKEK